MADVRVGGDVGVVVGVDEVDMVGSPAHHEYEDDESEHLHDLLLVVPALGDGGLRDQQSQGGLVSGPQVTAHLSIYQVGFDRLPFLFSQYIDILTDKDSSAKAFPAGFSEEHF